MINGEAIEEIKEKIKNQYHRNTSLRTRISDNAKPLRLFAQGEGVQVTAGPRVKAIMERMRKEMEQQKQVLDNKQLSCCVNCGVSFTICRMKNVIDCLKERGFIDSMTSEDLRDAANRPLKFTVALIPQLIAFI